MEQISFSVALIRRTFKQEVRWLAYLNRSRHLDFVIGHRLEQESFRESAIREVAWELNLDRYEDFQVGEVAQMNLEFVAQLPGQFGKSHVKASFYNVEIHHHVSIGSVDPGRPVFWVTSEEICEGVTYCGRRFDPMVPFLINRSQVIRYRESSSEK